MAINIANLNHRELNELITQAEERKAEIRKTRIEELRKEIVEMLAAEGFSLDDLWVTPPVGIRKARSVEGPRTRRKAAPKFRNPADPSITWSGRGKHPRWFSQALEKGISKEKMLIK